jgi:sterol 3beta-glucosyltransferase
MYGLSSYFLPQPKDYSANCLFTGFWFENSQNELDKDVLNFISNGEPPLFFTLGSMPFESKIDLVQTLNRITNELKVRLVVVRGWGLNNTEELEQNKNIKVISSAPYDRLLPHMKAAIHHGGIGTAAECMRAGKPFLTCPVLYPLGDQHFWGTIAYKRGLGLKPVPLKKMTGNKLIDSVKELISNEKLYSNSNMMMENLKKENGVMNAINLIENMRF